MSHSARPHRKTRRYGKARLWSLAIVTLSLGIAIGTLSAVALISPANENGQASLSELLDLPPNAINAVATHGVDNFAIATGRLDDNTEAIFFLDFVTAELKGAAISRQTGKFTALYRRKILQDFQGGEDPDAIKNPRFLLVTGLGSLQQRSGRNRYAKDLIYVVEVNSGKVAVYAAQDTRSSRATGSRTANDLTLVDTLSLRKPGAVRPGSRN